MQIAADNSANTLHNRARLFSRIPASIDLRSVSNCHAEHENWKTSAANNNFTKPLHVKTMNYENVPRGNEDDLPVDPRDWSRNDVKLWILSLGRSEGIHEGIEQIADECFRMNGKALCLFSVEMFMARFPLGGKMLYRDFRLRLCRALSST